MGGAKCDGFAHLLSGVLFTLLLRPDWFLSYNIGCMHEFMRNILQSGYNKYGWVIRSGKTTKGQIRQERFEVFCPARASVLWRGLR